MAKLNLANSYWYFVWRILVKPAGNCIFILKIINHTSKFIIHNNIELFHITKLSL